MFERDASAQGDPEIEKKASLVVPRRHGENLQTLIRGFQTGSVDIWQWQCKIGDKKFRVRRTKPPTAGAISWVTQRKTPDDREGDTEHTVGLPRGLEFFQKLTRFEPTGFILKRRHFLNHAIMQAVGPGSELQGWLNENPGQISSIDFDFLRQLSDTYVDSSGKKTSGRATRLEVEFNTHDGRDSFPWETFVEQFARFVKEQANVDIFRSALSQRKLADSQYHRFVNTPLATPEEAYIRLDATKNEIADIRRRISEIGVDWKRLLITSDPQVVIGAYRDRLTRQGMLASLASLQRAA